MVVEDAGPRLSWLITENGMTKLIAVFGFLIAFASPLLADEVTLGSMNYPPFYGDELEGNGPIINVVRRAYQLKGYKVNIQFLPWARAMDWAASGKIDGVVGVWYSQERSEHYLYSEPMASNRMGFYKRKGMDIHYQQYSDLVDKGYTLGAVRGFIFPEGLAESGIAIRWLNQGIQGFKTLAAGRVDLIVVDMDYAKYMMAKPELAGISSLIEWVDPVLDNRPQHLIVSKKSRDAAKKIQDFNAGLEQLKAEGFYDKAFQKQGIDIR